MSQDCCKALFASVLLVSIKDIRLYLRRHKLTSMPDGMEVAGESGEALRWFASTSTRPGGFLWVCSILDLEPDLVRETISRPRMADEKVRDRLRKFVEDEE